MKYIYSVYLCTFDKIVMWKCETFCENDKWLFHFPCPMSDVRYLWNLEKMIKSGEIFTVKNPEPETLCWRRFWNYEVSRELILHSSNDVRFEAESLQWHETCHMIFGQWRKPIGSIPFSNNCHSTRIQSAAVSWIVKKLLNDNSIQTQ
jgi:hypothetical protein